MEVFIKQLEERNCDLLKDVKRDANDFKNNVMRIERESNEKISTLNSKLKNEDEMNKILKQEIKDLESEINTLKKAGVSEDAKDSQILNMKKQLNHYENLKELFEVERRDFYKERERIDK